MNYVSLPLKQPRWNMFNKNRRLVSTIAIAWTIAVAIPEVARASPVAAPQPKSLEQVRQELDALYHSAEVATDVYNATKGKADREARRVATLRKEVARSEARVRRLEAHAGAAARAQYRGAGVPAEVQFLLSPRSRHTLDNASQARQIQLDITKLIAKMSTEKDALRSKEKKARNHLRELRASQEKANDSRDKIEERISKAQAIEGTLKTEQLKTLRKLEVDAADRAQRKWLDSGGLKNPGRSASSDGKKAVDYAIAQIGKPYVWGADGPESFDCSGLTSRAWAAAGHAIPRTSQEQWRRLPQVKMDEMRPGDLVLYFDDVSHVGVYMGNGAMVHAPRPGRNVTVAPVASMKIRGVVRPDA
ncbi:NlpC/P60 family protein [Streptomyces sp. NPDC029554]|uniref:C40 family peptidase n=1 Tax=Streptomyces sp. NPDC029554 TaxID=3155126 RepID=UPI0033F94CFE